MAYLHYTIKLNNAFQAAVSRWLSFLPTWNCVGMFYEQQWMFNIDLELVTDASDLDSNHYFQGVDGNYSQYQLEGALCAGTSGS